MDTLAEDPGSTPKTHTISHGRLSLLFQEIWGADTLSSPPQAPGTHEMNRHAGKANVRTIKVSKEKFKYMFK